MKLVNSADGVLLKQPDPDLGDTRTLLHSSYVDVVDGGLQEREHVVEHVVVGRTKHKMSLKQLVKSPERRRGPAGDGDLLKNDEELVDLILLRSNSQQIRTSAGGVEMFLDVCSCLRKQSHVCP